MVLTVAVSLFREFMVDILSDVLILFSHLFNRPIEGEDWLFNDESITVWDGTASDRAWKLLQKYLEQHDSEATNYRYRAAVLEKMLVTDPNVRLPPWLTQFYKVQKGFLVRL